MKKFIAILCTVFLMAGSANAFSTVMFDKGGTGNDANLLEYSLFQLIYTLDTIALPPSTFNIPSGTPASGNRTQHIWTFQDVATGAFTESFTAQVLQGQTTAPSTESFANTYIDVDLNGTYFSDTNIQFSGGTGTMYNNNDVIATFGFQSALISQLGGSILTPSDFLGMKIDFSFEFLTANTNYWGPNEEYLVGQNWLLSFVGGRVDQQAIYKDIPNNEYIIGWEFPGAQMKFDAVPEPGTMVLLGLGLLGIAGVSRKKIRS